MTYVQALYGGGGWPLSVFLSPDLKPLMGGTYFPPDDKYGRPGFKTILRFVTFLVVYSIYSRNTRHRNYKISLKNFEYQENHMKKLLC